MKPTAFEWHNESTGHCYVDYVPHNLMDENNGYTKTPLYKEEKILSIIGHDFEAIISSEVDKMVSERLGDLSDSDIEALAPYKGYSSGEYLHKRLGYIQALLDLKQGKINLKTISHD